MFPPLARGDISIVSACGLPSGHGQYAGVTINPTSKDPSAAGSGADHTPMMQQYLFGSLCSTIKQYFYRCFLAIYTVYIIQFPLVIL